MPWGLPAAQCNAVLDHMVKVLNYTGTYASSHGPHIWLLGLLAVLAELLPLQHRETTKHAAAALMGLAVEKESKVLVMLHAGVALVRLMRGQVREGAERGADGLPRLADSCSWEELWARDQTQAHRAAYGVRVQLFLIRACVHGASTTSNGQLSDKQPLAAFQTPHRGPTSSPGRSAGRLALPDEQPCPHYNAAVHSHPRQLTANPCTHYYMALVVLSSSPTQDAELAANARDAVAAAAEHLEARRTVEMLLSMVGQGVKGNIFRPYLGGQL